MPDKPSLATSTEAVHGGDGSPQAFDALPTPIVQTATYSFASTDELEAYMEGRHPRPEREEYGRYGNPTCRALERRLAHLDHAEDALVFGSGMAALTTTLLALTKSGDHVVLFRDAYRQSRNFVTGFLSKYGVRSTLVEPGSLEALRSALTPSTKVIVTEMPTNPYLRCVDLEALGALARSQRGLRTVVDATFATPMNCRPLDWGADLVVHSATKYLSGHNDVLAGSVAGASHLVSLVRDVRNMMGGIADPHAAFLVARGLKTLALRVARQNETALAVARTLEGRSEVEAVFYPGLPSHPDYAVARRQMDGHGGVVTFVLRGGLPAARRFCDGMILAKIAPSLGGVESLVEPPALMSYHELSSEQRAALGIADGLVRLAVGIEETADVVEDVERGLRRCGSES